MKRVILVLSFVILLMTGGYSQGKISITSDDYNNTEVEMADRFRADGKIYVVVAVILVIIGGLFLYLYKLDRKVSKMERAIDERKSADADH